MNADTDNYSDLEVLNFRISVIFFIRKMRIKLSNFIIIHKNSHLDFETISKDENQALIAAQEPMRGTLLLCFLFPFFWDFASIIIGESCFNALFSILFFQLLY
jgi:hypothetical protein